MKPAADEETFLAVKFRGIRSKMCSRQLQMTKRGVADALILELVVKTSFILGRVGCAEGVAALFL